MNSLNKMQLEWENIPRKHYVDRLYSCAAAEYEHLCCLGTQREVDKGYVWVQVPLTAVREYIISRISKCSHYNKWILTTHINLTEVPPTFPMQK